PRLIPPAPSVLPRTPGSLLAAKGNGKPVSIFLPKLYVTKNFQNQPTRMIRPAMPAHINKVTPIADGAMPAHTRIPELPAFQPNKSG
ncbi:hypothetical protein, partial [Chromobacterium violaceum]